MARASLCKNMARANNIRPLSLGGGGGTNGKDPILFLPPDAYFTPLFLHNDLLCNDPCSVTGACITYWGA